MPIINFLDRPSFSAGNAVTGEELLDKFYPDLQQVVAVRVNTALWDLNRPITEDAHIEFVLANTEEGLEILRHDAAHATAQAVKELFPETQVTIGPAIENGFYYDFYRETPFTPEDLEKIEQRMHDIVARNELVTRKVLNRSDAETFFLNSGETFKAEIVRDLPPDQEITIYSQGHFTDLCRGPHLTSTGKLGTAFKLMKVAGAYWRGNSKNPMLQRIYGTAWATQTDLETYLHRLEEAEKRDHRRLGKEMGLFHFQEEGAGSIFWHAKGWDLYRTLQDFIRSRLDGSYEEVNTPILMDRSLWEASGHWEKFSEHMFITQTENRSFALKPMNCPCHVQIFKQGLKSYRDLPLRMAEFGACHRYEPSGALHGLMRLRAFAQDDAHIFCTPNQIMEETKTFCALLLKIYADLGLTDVRVKFSDRPEKRAGSDEVWDKAESALIDALKATGLPYTLNPGEGAFYGPKLEFVLRDAIGRDWQCGTFQVDFILPERLDAEYVGEDGARHRPVMLHRAILGSLERFIGILLEHYAGRLPLWLSPVPVVILPITQEDHTYATTINQQLKDQGVKSIIDLRNEKIGYKIRDHSLQKIPLQIVVGKKERADQSFVLRRLGSVTQEIFSLSQGIEVLKNAIQRPA